MERKQGFLKECICYIIIVGWVFWCLNKQIKLMRIDFSAVTAENTAAVVEYDCISMKGSFFTFQSMRWSWTERSIGINPFYSRERKVLREQQSGTTRPIPRSFTV